MFKLFKTIKAVKKLRKIKADEKWLGNLRLNFTNNSEEKSANRPAFPKIRIAVVTAGMLIFMLLSGGLVSSAQAALPTDILYGLKLFSEQVQSFLVFGDENKINFILKLAEKRLEEAEDQTQIILANFTEEEDDEDGEIIIVGTIFRAQDNLEKAGALIKKVSASGKLKNLKKAEKAFEQLERLAKRKNQMAEKFAKKLPSIAAALDAFDFISVDIEEEANKIIITINLEETENNDEDEDNDEDNDENDNDEDGDEDEEDDSNVFSSISTQELFKKRAEKVIIRAEKKIELVENKLEHFLNAPLIIFPFTLSIELDDEDDLKNLRKDLKDLLKAKGKLKKNHKNGIDRKKLIERFEDSFEDAAEKLEEARDKIKDAQEEFAEGDYKKAIKKANEAFKKAVKAGSKINRGRLFEELPDDPEEPDEPEDDATPPVISQITVEASTTSATVSWLTDEPADSLINYGTSTDYTEVASSTELVTSHAITIDSLTASSTFHFQVRSEDASGNVATSTDLTFTTLEPEPEPDITPPVISSITALNVSSSSATVSWLTDEPTTGTLFYSLVSPVEPAGTSTVIHENTEFLTDHSFDLTNLNASSTYHFMIEATDVSENTATSSESSFETTG